jgi:hypothetical protein
MITLTARSYKAGDCVTWNQDVAAMSERQTSPADWETIRNNNCGGPVSTYLGYTLDPHGKF